MVGGADVVRSTANGRTGLQFAATGGVCLDSGQIDDEGKSLSSSRHVVNRASSIFT